MAQEKINAHGSTIPPGTKTHKNAMKVYSFIFKRVFLVIAVVVSLVINCNPRTKTLTQLDQYCSQMASPSFNSQLVLPLFMDYYQHTQVPDSLILVIDQIIDSLESVRIDLPERNSLTVSQNQYVLDTSLAKLSYSLVLALFQHNDAMINRVKKLATETATRHASLTSNPYWPQHIKNVSAFSKVECEAWLEARHAENQCYVYHTADSSLERARHYGALALQKLAVVPDPRIELDVMQRLIYIHHHNESLYHLAIFLSDYFSQKAESVSYHSRYMALRYHHCFTLGMAGYNDHSIREYDKLLNYVEKNPNTPNLAEYKERTILGKTGILDDQCNLNEMSAVFNSIRVEDFQDTFRQSEYLILHGTFLSHIGELHKSEKLQKRALQIAHNDKNIANEIDALLELATLYRKLTEFDQAKTQLDSIASILLANNNKHKQYYFDLYLNYADLYVNMGKPQLAHEYANMASLRAMERDIPFEKAKSLHSLSRTFMGIGDDSLAIAALEDAYSIFQDYGLTKFSIETQLDLAQNHIKLSHHRPANKSLGIVRNLLEASEEEWYKLEFQALLGEYEFNRGNRQAAVKHSNTYIQLLNQFNKKLLDYDKIKGLNQRTFEVLQKAVFYELQLGRYDSAFVKLEFSKARALQAKRIGKNSSVHNSFLNLEQLHSDMSPRELILSYFVSSDTLFTFAVTRDSLQLFRTKIKKSNLVALSQKYLQTIQQTIKGINILDLDEQFKKTSTLGSELSAILLNDAQLASLFKNADITFIVADDILHSIPFSCLTIPSADTMQFWINESAILNLPSSFFYHHKPHIFTEKYSQKQIIYSIDPGFPGAARLSRFIKKHFSKAQALVLDDEFSKEKVTKTLSNGASIYLFFGHSVPNFRFPDASTIDLCINNTSDSTYRIEAFTIADLKKVDWTAAETVYLIGCETGTGLFYRGSGLASIGEGLLQMGVPEIIASYWKIDEKFAVRQIQRFLLERINQTNSAVALRMAQLEIVDQLKRDQVFQQAHPSLWACLSVFQAYY